MNASPNDYVTNSELSRASGQSRFAVHRGLKARGVSPATTVSRDGNPASAFHIAELPEKLREAIDPYQLAALAELAKCWKDASHPSDREQACLLDCAFLKLDELVRRGARERIMKARQIAWLAKNVPALAPNEAALRLTYNRYLKRWRNGGKKLQAIYDSRREAGKLRRAPRLPQADIDRLSAFAVVKFGGRLDPAWRQEWPSLSAETRDRYPLGREVPARIRQQVLPEVRRLMPWHIGPRAARLNGAYITRSWEDLYAGDVDSMDDHTLDNLIYREENPYELLRPQLLLQIDTRSGYVINFALELEKSWTAVTALGLIRRKAKTIGQPRLGHYWERGKFKDAKILGKGGFANIFSDERENFADRLGIKIRHALPGNARAKIVERELGVLAAAMAGEPGYVGNDEMHVKYEAVHRAALDVKAKRMHPREAGFLSDREMEARLHQIIDRINNTERESIRYDGERMTRAQAWEKFQPRNAAGEVVGLVKLPDSLEYLLSSYIDIVAVTRGGVSLFNGKYRYCSTETGAVQGESVKVYFDPERPESIAITDLDGENVRTIPLMPKPSAWTNDEQGDELLAKASAARNAHNRAASRRYSELNHKFFPPVRALIADPASMEKGREMERGRAEITERNRKRTADELRKENQEEEKERERMRAECEKFERDNFWDLV